jgi:phosphoglycolate phosphatase-like HAD superfamily hydrolase
MTKLFNLQLKPEHYQSYIFDCDGVLLNSNKIKTNAFYSVALKYGIIPAEKLRNYHVNNGGISRYKKIEYFIEDILGKKFDKREFDELVNEFAQVVKNELLSCELAAGLNEFREKTKNSKWHIVSGGDQGELREVFNQRDLISKFDGGIFGSPDTKDEILLREITNGNIKKPAIFFGDSKYDYQVAVKASVDFIFISSWSEVDDWESFCRSYSLFHYSNLEEFSSFLN